MYFKYLSYFFFLYYMFLMKIFKTACYSGSQEWGLLLLKIIPFSKSCLRYSKKAQSYPLHFLTPKRFLKKSLHRQESNIHLGYRERKLGSAASWWVLSCGRSEVWILLSLQGAFLWSRNCPRKCNITTKFL